MSEPSPERKPYHRQASLNYGPKPRTSGSHVVADIELKIEQIEARISCFRCQMTVRLIHFVLLGGQERAVSASVGESV